MMNTKLLFPLVLALGLASCASGPSHTEAAHALTPRGGNGVLVVYREPGFMGAASKPFIWIDGAKMPGQLARGGFYTQPATPGRHQVVFSWKDHRPTVAENITAGVFGGALGVAGNYLGHEKISTTVDVRPGQTHYVLMDGVELSEVSKEDGEEAISECAWLNPSGR